MSRIDDVQESAINELDAAAEAFDSAHEELTYLVKVGRPNSNRAAVRLVQIRNQISELIELVREIS